jgi:Phospholipase_D-nuclease N-terminal
MAPEQCPRWRGMSPTRRIGMVMVALVQFALAGAAWVDLARRPSSQVRGPKWRWGLIIAVNFVGPLSYFRWGRIHTAQESVIEGGR